MIVNAPYPPAWFSSGLPFQDLSKPDLKSPNLRLFNGALVKSGNAKPEENEAGAQNRANLLQFTSLSSLSR